MKEAIGIVIIAIGVAFDFFGCIGLVRLPDIYNRLQAATKCVTLGTCFILLGVIILGGSTALALKAVACAAFIILTSPTAAHALSRGAYKSGVQLWEESVVDKYKEDSEK